MLTTDLELAGFHINGGVVCIAAPTGWMFDHVGTARKLLQWMKKPVRPNSREAEEIASILDQDDDYYRAWKKAKREDRTDINSWDEHPEAEQRGGGTPSNFSPSRTIHNEIDMRPLMQKSIKMWFDDDPENARNGNKSAVHTLKLIMKMHIK